MMPKGRCDCGSVRFETGRLAPEVTACHCGQCRRLSGHYWVVARGRKSDLRLLSDAGLSWYRSSDSAKRGFCRFCGSSLFFELNDHDVLGVAAGCLDKPTGLKIAKHIFVADKGDYYNITDGLPQAGRY